MYDQPLAPQWFTELLPFRLNLLMFEITIINYNQYTLFRGFNIIFEKSTNGKLLIVLFIGIPFII